MKRLLLIGMRMDRRIKKGITVLEEEEQTQK